MWQAMKPGQTEDMEENNESMQLPSPFSHDCDTAPPGHHSVRFQSA